MVSCGKRGSLAVAVDVTVSSGSFRWQKARNSSSAQSSRPEPASVLRPRASRRFRWSWTGDNHVRLRLDNRIRVGRKRFLLLGLLGEDFAVNGKRRADPDRVVKMIPPRIGSVRMNQNAQPPEIGR